LKLKFFYSKGDENGNKNPIRLASDEVLGNSLLKQGIGTFLKSLRLRDLAASLSLAKNKSCDK
jgi:hypothetical protein